MFVKFSLKDKYSGKETEIWALNLTPVGSFLWKYVRIKVCSLIQLQENIRLEMTAIMVYLVRAVVRNFAFRLLSAAGVKDYLR